MPLDQAVAANLFVGECVDTVLLLPLGGEALREEHVKIAPAQVAVGRRRQHRELALDKPDNRDRRVHRADVNECDIGGLVGGQIGLVDTVGEGGCEERRQKAPCERLKEKFRTADRAKSVGRQTERWVTATSPPSGRQTPPKREGRGGGGVLACGRIVHEAEAIEASD
eukprot:1168214-Prymnesium_polylepis.1